MRISFTVMMVLAGLSTAIADDKPAAKKSRPPVVLTERAKKLHAQCIVIDGHNDLPWVMRTKAGSSFKQVDIAKPQPKFHTDIPRLKQGGIGAQFWSAYPPASTRQQRRAAHYTLEQIDLVHRMVKRYPGTFEMAGTVDDIRRIRKKGKIACLIGVEGGHAIENSISLLRVYYGLGVRYMTLTHSDTLDWADSATDKPKSKGLSPFGEEVVREMNRLGMLVDISHVSVETMKDALRVSKAPIIASHSSARAVADHPRNVPDDVLKLVKKNGGVIMVNYFSGFVVPSSAKQMAKMFDASRELRRKFPDDRDFNREYTKWKLAHKMDPGTIHDVVDHIDHIVKIAGVDHVGLGSDYDGVSMLPKQLHDVSTYPLITQELLNRGYTDGQVKKILGENLLRALNGAEETAKRMQREEEIPEKVMRWLGPQKWVRDTPDAVLKLGERGSFDDTHIMAPLVKKIDGKYVMLYVGSSGSAYDLAPKRMPDNRVYRLGLATSKDGKTFEKHAKPVAEMKDAKRSFLTPTILSNADGTLIKENGKYRMWFCSATLGGGGRPHAVQHATSEDGIRWSNFSDDLITRAYCPIVIKDGGEYRMWYSEPGRYPWVIRHARSKDGFKWIVDKKPAIEKTQTWEHYVFNYAKVIKVDGVYLMWYTSYATADRLTTAIGFAASADGIIWHKHPENPVFKPNPKRAWESNYVSCGTVMRMSDGRFRLWYFARKKPPFKNLYDAFGTAAWAGPDLSK